MQFIDGKPRRYTKHAREHERGVSTCPKCGQVKALDQFGRDRRYDPPRVKSWCLECQRAANREWKARPEVRAARARRYHALRAAGLSPDQASSGR